jgi:hypothetical protein
MYTEDDDKKVTIIYVFMHMYITLVWTLETGEC